MIKHSYKCKLDILHRKTHLVGKTENTANIKIVNHELVIQLKFLQFTPRKTSFYLVYTEEIKLFTRHPKNFVNNQIFCFKMTYFIN